MTANATVTATYGGGTISSITVTPNTAIIGTEVQFTANVTGTGSFTTGVNWSVAAPNSRQYSQSGHHHRYGTRHNAVSRSADSDGDATSTQDATKSGSTVVKRSFSRP